MMALHFNCSIHSIRYLLLPWLIYHFFCVSFPLLLIALCTALSTTLNSRLAILCLAVGVVYFILGVACRKMDQSQQPGQQPDAIAEMKKQATQKAVEHVIENSNPFA
jgi:hypothetical protein